jgi:hypothetical protein
MASGEPPVGVRLRPIFVSPGCNRASGRHWREPDAAPATTRPPNAVCAGAERRTRDGRGGAGWDQDSRQCQLSQEHASKNPAMVRDNRHASVHLFGAICPARCTGAAIIMPVVNTEAMNEQLKEMPPCRRRSLSRLVWAVQRNRRRLYQGVRADCNRAREPNATFDYRSTLANTRRLTTLDTASNQARASRAAESLEAACITLPNISQSAHIKPIIHRPEAGPATTWLSERCSAPCFRLEFSRGGYHNLSRCATLRPNTTTQACVGDASLSEPPCIRCAATRISGTGICLRDLSAVQSRDARREHSR